MRSARIQIGDRSRTAARGSFGSAGARRGSLLVALLAALFAACGPAPPEQRPEQASRPHVVLLLIDTLRADRLHDERPLTPHLDGLAGRSVVFQRAIAPACWTKPSVASLFTGLYPGRHGALGTPQRRPNLAFLDASFTTLAELLRQAGYRTGAFVSNPHILPTYRFDQGFDHFVQPAGPADELLGAAGDWLAGAPGDGPSFLYLHLIDPHAPYDPPEDARRRWVPGPGPDQAAFTRAGLPLEITTWLKHQRSRPGAPFDTSRLRPDLLEPGLVADVRRHAPDFTPGTLLDHARFDFAGPDDPALIARVDHLQALYDAEVAATDAAIGRFLQRLDALGLGDDTLLLVVADHGEAFLERGTWGHGNGLSPEELEVPFLLCPPRREGRSDTVVEAPVSLVDVLPTLTDLLDLPTPAGLDGVSLVPWMEQRGDPDRLVYAELIHDDREELAVWSGRAGLVRRTRTGEAPRWQGFLHAGGGERSPIGTPATKPAASDEAVPAEEGLRRALEQRGPWRLFDPHKPLPLGELTDEQRAALRALGYG